MGPERMDWRVHSNETNGRSGANEAETLGKARGPEEDSQRNGFPRCLETLSVLAPLRCSIPFLLTAKAPRREADGSVGWASKLKALIGVFAVRFRHYLTAKAQRREGESEERSKT